MGNRARTCCCNIFRVWFVACRSVGRLVGVSLDSFVYALALALALLTLLIIQEPQDNPSKTRPHLVNIEMSATGTYRSTPKNRGQNPFQDSPSAIPRPKFESTPSHASDAMSTLSASRAKQSKRDEVGSASCMRIQ